MKIFFGSVRLLLQEVKDILVLYGESLGLIQNFVGKMQFLLHVVMISKLLFGVKMKFLCYQIAQFKINNKHNKTKTKNKISKNLGKRKCNF